MSNETCAECHGTGSARHDPDRPRHTCPDCNGQGEVGDGKENHALFGRLVWNMIQRKGDDFCGDEWSEEILPLAQRAGLCRRVEYSPDKHGDIDYAEPGDVIWYWEKTMEAQQ